MYTAAGGAIRAPRAPPPGSRLWLGLEVVDIRHRGEGRDGCDRRCEREGWTSEEKP
jgi:hypothetical protein